MKIMKKYNVLVVIILCGFFQSCEEKEPLPLPVQEKKPPVIKPIPVQIINEGGEFRDVMLSEFVSDEKFSFDKLNIVIGHGKNVDATLDPKGIIHVNAKDDNWNGIDTITIKVSNTYGLEAEFPMMVEVKSVNDSPSIARIPEQQIFEGESFPAISLQKFVVDPDNNNSEITWSIKSSKELKAEIIKNKLYVSPPNADWNGTEKITLIASDGIGGFASRIVEFSILPVNDAPQLKDIHAQVIQEGGIFPLINVSDYVNDVDNSISELTFNTTATGKITVQMEGGKIIALTPDPDWFGSETVTLDVTDPGGLSAQTTVQFVIKPVNDSPQLARIPVQEIKEGESFNKIYLNEYVADVDNSADEMKWTFSNSQNIKIGIINNILTASPLDRDWYGCDTLKLIVHDKGGSTSESPLIFKVNEAPFYENQPYKGIKNIAITGVNDVYSLITNPLRWESKDLVNFGLVFSGTIMLTGIDERVRESAIKNRDVADTDIMKAAEFYGHPVVSQVSALALGAYGITFSDDTALRMGLEIFEAYFISNNIQSILKRFIGRTRPEKGEGGFQYDPFPNVKVQEKSMPSGHAILAFTMSSVIAAHTESPYLKALIFTPAFLTAVERIYEDRHWVSDVFFGAALGYFVGNFVVGRHENGVEDKFFFTLDEVGRMGIGYRF